MIGIPRLSKLVSALAVSVKGKLYLCPLTMSTKLHERYYSESESERYYITLLKPNTDRITEALALSRINNNFCDVTLVHEDKTTKKPKKKYKNQ